MKFPFKVDKNMHIVHNQNIAAGDLAVQGARASAAMVLIYFTWSIMDIIEIKKSGSNLFKAQ